MKRTFSNHPNMQLRQARIECNWRQRDLADLLGTTVVTIRRWERGSHRPSAYYRIKLCALFGKTAQELGLIEENIAFLESTKHQYLKVATLPQFSIEEDVIWTVPYARNPYFSGRKDILEFLVQYFLPEERSKTLYFSSSVLSQPLAIKGLAGVGKTQIAIEYAYLSREQSCYTHILWVNAESEESLLADFRTLANFRSDIQSEYEHEQQKLAASIKHWLEELQQSWLLIFDNVTNLSFLQKYLPRWGNGKLILTTRINIISSVAHPLSLEPMDLMEGTCFLLRRTGRENLSDEMYNEAVNVVITLGGFPLALEQAGAYIEETQCNFEDYLQIYQVHRKALLSHTGNSANSVVRAWLLLFQEVEQANLAAAELLRLCVFLGPDNIPEELLKEGSSYWPPILQQSIIDPLAFNQMLGTLLTFSLIKRHAEDHLLSIHCLIQIILLDAMKSEEKQQWAERIVLAIHSIFKRKLIEEGDTWQLFPRYLQPLQVCITLIDQYCLVNLDAAEILIQVASYFLKCNSFELAESLSQQALLIYKKILGPQHQIVRCLQAELTQRTNLLAQEEATSFFLVRLADEKPLDRQVMTLAENANDSTPQT